MINKTIIALRPPEGSRLPVEYIVAWILDKFPGSHIIHENSFEAERERYRLRFKQGAVQGEIDGNPKLGVNLILQSSLGKEQRNGTGKDILISVIGSETIRGRVWGSSALFFTDLPIVHEGVQQLGDFLSGLQFGEPSIYSDNDEE